MLNIDIKTINDALAEARMTAMDKECGMEELRNICWRLSLLLANVIGALVGIDYMIEEGAIMNDKRTDCQNKDILCEEGDRRS